MSGLIKGVKKVFKRVAKVVKKVAPVALAAGAILFTAGSALGVTGMAGGWGAVASSVGSVFGETLAPIVTGAVTQAGYGAAIGGAAALITGGDVSKGALIGAAGGAVTGGIGGAMGFNTDPLANMNGSGDAVVGGTGADQITGGPAATNPNVGITGEPATGQTAAITGGPTPGAFDVPSSAANAGAAKNASTGGFFGADGFFGKDKFGQSAAFGGMLSGAGSAAVQALLSGDSATKQQLEIYANNYQLPSGGGGFNQPAPPQRQANLPTPEQKFGQRPRFAYSPSQRRVIQVPAT